MITEELLSLVLREEVTDVFDRPLKERIYYEADESCSVSYDTLTRLCKEFIISGTNDILNTYNSSSIQGWVVSSSIYNKQWTAETEFKAVLKATKFIAKERGEIK